MKNFQNSYKSEIPKKKKKTIGNILEIGESWKFIKMYKFPKLTDSRKIRKSKKLKI